MENNVQYCPTCGQPIKNYRLTFTKRNLIWLYALGYIGKQKYANEGYWVNYKEVHELVAKNFGKFVDGKWRPMVLSSYGSMGDKPWELIINNDETDEKFRSKGDWKLTPKGIAFINNKVMIPEIIWINHDGVYQTSRDIKADEVKGVTFAELVDKFNSF